MLYYVLCPYELCYKEVARASGTSGLFRDNDSDPS